MRALDHILRDGTSIVLSHGCAEPAPLVDAVLERADAGTSLELFLGVTWNRRLLEQPPAALRFASFGALGGVRRLDRDGRLRVVPCNMSDLPRLFAERHLRCDVAMVQVSPPDAAGMCSLGVGVDYVGDVLPHAATIVAEVNARMPATRGGPAIHRDSLDVVIESDRPLVELPTREPDATDRDIAASVAELVDDGATLQFGVGPLPTAILGALAGHRDLGIHSGLVNDVVLDLQDAGALTGARKGRDRGLVVTGTVLGSQTLFDRLGELPLEVRPTSSTHDPSTLAELDNLVAINSAVQVDLTGQVNAEVRDGVHVGAVGGQPDFARAASRSGGLSIIALRSTHRGASTIVGDLEQGVVTTPRSAVDVVVTEHGVAWLRGKDLEARTREMIAIADPAHRDELAQTHDRPKTGSMR